MRERTSLLRSVLDITFRRIAPEDVISNLLDINKPSSAYKENTIYSQSFGKESFQRPAREHLSYYSSDQLTAIQKHISAAVKKHLLKEPVEPEDIAEIGGYNVFGLVGLYAKRVLVEDETGVLCSFNRLMSWRSISHQLGEDLFTTAFLADRDHKYKRIRNDFSWPDVIKTDNLRLKNLFKRGLADNHFHLNASNPVFDLKWILMMNLIYGESKPKIRKAIEVYSGNYLSTNIEYSYRKTNISLYDLCYIAAIIRLLLYKKMNESDRPLSFGTANDLSTNENSESDMFFKLIKNNNTLIESQFDDIVLNYIERLKYLNSGKRIDYAMPCDFSGEEQHFLDGERKLMYRMFQLNREMKPENTIYLEMFYLYILIKIRMRQEMVQVNSYYGFDNFSRYEMRKDDMFDHIPHSQLYRYYYAINNVLKNENVVSLELRIVPPDTTSALVEKINNIDNVIKRKNHPSISASEMSVYAKEKMLEELAKLGVYSDDFTKEAGCFDSVSFVLHFPKEEDKTTDNLVKQYKELRKKEDKFLQYSTGLCRHHEFRERLKKHCQAIIMLRNTNPSVAKRVYGIDACANEVNCRPEVFAVAFRYLRNHKARRVRLENEPQLHNLRMTYHVGEDFYDIVDGLRAIDEAVKFLHLGEGSRIGHALALGIDVRKWYQYKQKTITLPIQNLIDNLAWMYSRMMGFNIENSMLLSNRLTKDFERFFDKVYELDTTEAVNIRKYFDSWKLRGHDPSLISRKFVNDRDMYTLEDKSIKYNDWEQYLFNSSYGDFSGSNLIKKLYFRYHFDSNAKVKGTRMIHYDIDEEYMQAVEKLQLAMQKQIRDLHIGIETNPSSNVLIGRLQRYDAHPISRLYNVGLSYDNYAISNIPQNFVSINTDDKGVFNTCIENEYALLACSMEKLRNPDNSHKYSEDQIYNWLNNIRVMGLEQSFKPINREKMEV